MPSPTFAPSSARRARLFITVAALSAVTASAVGCRATTVRIAQSEAAADGGASGTPPGDDAGDAGDESTCSGGLASAFAKSPEELTLPSARCGVSFSALASSYGDLRYTLLDVDADRRSDLVVTADTCDEDVGVDRWDVYRATEGGFAKTPSAFAVPAARCGVPFDATASYTGDVRFSTFDVDGDRRLDLVVTTDACDDEVGTKRWDVYRATDDGFAPTPSAFTIPAARCNVPFDTTGLSSANVNFAMIDVDGDRRPDLVVTADTCDEEVGTKRWDVYRGSESGFATTPDAFALPAPRCDESFARTASASAKIRYSLLDMDGDRRLDLVVTGDACDEEVGTKHWDVYRSEETGFTKAPAAFTVPAPRCGTRFVAAAAFERDLAFTTFDVSCDGIGDLVVLADACDEEVGTKRWEVYEASAGGFAAVPSSISLPTPRCGASFDAVARSVGDLRYSLHDVTADGRGDLLVTSDTCDPDVGVRRWDAYPLSP